MDLSTLFTAALLFLATLGLDTVLYPRDIVLEAQVSPKIEGVMITHDMMNDVLHDEVVRISATPSVVTKPVVHMAHENRVSLSLAQAMGLSKVALSLQTQVGYEPDQIKIYAFSENSVLRMLVTGDGHRRIGPFQQEIEQAKGESLIAMIRRATLVAMARIDPYTTALYLIQRHSDDKAFQKPRAIIDFVKSGLPANGVSAERSRFENLEGIMLLFTNAVQEAHDKFAQAVASDPSVHIPVLNLALTKLALDRDAEGVALMRRMLKEAPPPDPLIRTIAYLTLAAGYMGIHELAEGEAWIQKALALTPDCPPAYGLWAEAELARGNPEVADALRRKAADLPHTTRDYAEVASLYFRLAWQDGGPVIRTPWERRKDAVHIEGVPSTAP
ncbi:MAG: tetratricopeptide repeat protein [Acetobacteraceae bacterium]